MSRVIGWLHNAIGMRDSDEPEDAPKKLTVRVDSYEYEELSALAKRLEVSKTHCAEQLLKAAIVDAAQELSELRHGTGAFDDSDDAIRTAVAERQGVG
jgi:hypothetical protein